MPPGTRRPIPSRSSITNEARAAGYPLGVDTLGIESLGDIPNFSNVEAEIQISEVLVGGPHS